MSSDKKEDSKPNLQDVRIVAKAALIEKPDAPQHAEVQQAANYTLKKADEQAWGAWEKNATPTQLKMWEKWRAKDRDSGW